VPNDRPQNPVVATWLWFGYWGDRGAPIVTALTALGTIGGAFGITHSGWWWFLIVGAALLPVPGAFWRRREERADVEVDARELLMENNLPALLELAAGTMSESKTERVRAAQSAFERVLSDLRNAFDDVADVRVVGFTVDDDGNAMTPLPPAGRHVRPHPFVRGTARGDKAFEVLEGAAPYVIVEDLAKTTPGMWAGTGEGYSTFITAPIRSSKDGFGLLTIDAPKPESLDARHASTLALFASALGVFFAEATRNGGGSR